MAFQSREFWTEHVHDLTLLFRSHVKSSGSLENVSALTFQSLDFDGHSTPLRGCQRSRPSLGKCRRCYSAKFLPSTRTSLFSVMAALPSQSGRTDLWFLQRRYLHNGDIFKGKGQAYKGKGTGIAEMTTLLDTPSDGIGASLRKRG